MTSLLTEVNWPPALAQRFGGSAVLAGAGGGGRRWLRQGVGCLQEEVLWDQGPEVGVSRGRVWKETPRPAMSDVRGHEEGLSGAESEG